MEKEKLSLTIDEAAEMMGVGRNMMLKIAKIDSFPAIQFEKKIIINGVSFNRYVLKKDNAKTDKYKALLQQFIAN